MFITPDGKTIPQKDSVYADRSQQLLTYMHYMQWYNAVYGTKPVEMRNNNLITPKPSICERSCQGAIPYKPLLSRDWIPPGIKVSLWSRPGSQEITWTSVAKTTSSEITGTVILTHKLLPWSIVNLHHKPSQKFTYHTPLNVFAIRERRWWEKS